MVTGGTGSGDVNEAYMVSLTDGLKAASLTAEPTLAGSLHRLPRGIRKNNPPPARHVDEMGAPRAGDARGHGRRDHAPLARRPTSA